MQNKVNFVKIFKVFRDNYKEIPLISIAKTPYQTLVSVMLSARTSDITTSQRCKVLFNKYPSAKEIAKMSISEIENIIKPVGFYKTKAKALKQLSQIILEKFNNKIPKTLEGLILLPGVGRKTANIVLARCFNIPVIGVDTHVHRISNFLKIVSTKTPLETEKELYNVLPKKYWIDVNNLFVSIGQQYRNNNLLKTFLEKNKLI